MCFKIWSSVINSVVLCCCGVYMNIVYVAEVRLELNLILCSSKRPLHFHSVLSGFLLLFTKLIRFFFCCSISVYRACVSVDLALCQPWWPWSIFGITEYLVSNGFLLLLSISLLWMKWVCVYFHHRWARACVSAGGTIRLENFSFCQRRVFYPLYICRHTNLSA